MSALVQEPKLVWSETYRGHQVATLRDQSGWCVVCDQAVQQGVRFDDPEEAAAWIKRRVDDRIAESIFPGLALARSSLLWEI